MHNRHVQPTELWLLDSPRSRVVSALLLPFSCLYGFGWVCYESIYRLGLKKRIQIPGLQIIGVGNLEVGGMGKTPVAIEIARLMIETGKRIAVSASAYGSPASVGASMAPDGRLSPAKHGDEATLIRQALPNVPLILGRDRVRAAELAKESGMEALILDDGYQHLPLGRDADLLLWNSCVRNRRCLPSGPMREPQGGIRRADAFVGSDSVGLPGGDSRPFFRFQRQFTGLVSVFSEETVPISWIEGRKVDALCAIGRPGQFRESLIELGASIERFDFLGDHNSLQALPNGFELGSELPCIVTEKDAVKIRESSHRSSRFWALQMRVQFTDSKEILRWLQDEKSR